MGGRRATRRTRQPSSSGGAAVTRGLLSCRLFGSPPLTTIVAHFAWEQVVPKVPTSWDQRSGRKQVAAADRRRDDPDDEGPVAIDPGVGLLLSVGELAGHHRSLTSDEHTPPGLVELVDLVHLERDRPAHGVAFGVGVGRLRLTDGRPFARRNKRLPAHWSERCTACDHADTYEKTVRDT